MADAIQTQRKQTSEFLDFSARSTAQGQHGTREDGKEEEEDRGKTLS